MRDVMAGAMPAKFEEETAGAWCALQCYRVNILRHVLSMHRKMLGQTHTRIKFTFAATSVTLKVIHSPFRVEYKKFCANERRRGKDELHDSRGPNER